MKDLKSIDQTGIAALVAERMNNPVLYVEKPLVIWRSHFRDGVQEGVLREVVKAYNKNKSDKEKRLFWVLDVDGENNSSEYFSKPDVLGFYIVQPSAHSTPFIENKMREIGEKFRVPVVCFMPCDVAEEFSAAEQYVFEPDFGQWAAMYAVHSEIMEFIRGDGDKAGIAYRWYNRFNACNENKRCGVDIPEVWLEAAVRLGFAMRLTCVRNLCELPEKSFRSAFREGISADVVDEFWEFVQNIQRKEQ